MIDIDIGIQWLLEVRSLVFYRYSRKL